MTTWTSSDLAAINSVDEVLIATRRADGTLRSPRIVWVVRHDDSLYVRSVNGTDAAWYRGVQTAHAGTVTAGTLTRDITFAEVGDHVGDSPELDDALDAAYRAKYRRWPGPVEHITNATARATTLRLDPA